MSTREMKINVLSTTQLRATRNALDAATRKASIELINGLLAETIDVAMSSRHAYWNLRGAGFRSHRDLFDEVWQGLNLVAGTLAEREVALGGIARGTVQQVANETALPPYPVYSIADDEHVNAIATRLGTLSRSVHEAVRRSDRGGDIATLDLLAEVCRTIECLLWKVECHGTLRQ